MKEKILVTTSEKKDTTMRYEGESMRFLFMKKYLFYTGDKKNLHYW